jgi:hypothetical protein
MSFFLPLNSILPLMLFRKFRHLSDNFCIFKNLSTAILWDYTAALATAVKYFWKPFPQYLIARRLFFSQPNFLIDGMISQIPFKNNLSLNSWHISPSEPGYSTAPELKDASQPLSVEVSQREGGDHMGIPDPGMEMGH